MKKIVGIIIITLFVFSLQDVFAESAWEIKCSVPNKTIYVREPLFVEVQIKNISKESKQFKRQGKGVIIKKGNEPGSMYLIYQGSSRNRSTEKVYLRKIKPNETLYKSFWLLVGTKVKESDDYNWKWEFPFNSSGEYSIELPGYSKGIIKMSVKEPDVKEDIEAQKLFNLSSAKAFIGDKIKEGNVNIQTIYQKYPKSYLAPYAAYRLAWNLWKEQGGFRVDFKLYSEYVNHIIHNSPDHFMRENAYFMLAQGYAFQEGKKQEVRDTLLELAKKYPESRSLNLSLKRRIILSLR